MTDYLTVNSMVGLIEQTMFQLEDFYEGMENEQHKQDINELLDALYATVAEVRLMLRRWSDQMEEPF